MMWHYFLRVLEHPLIALSILVMIVITVALAVWAIKVLR